MTIELDTTIEDEVQSWIESYQELYCLPSPSSSLCEACNSLAIVRVSHYVINQQLNVGYICTLCEYCPICLEKFYIRGSLNNPSQPVRLCGCREQEIN